MFEDKAACDRNFEALTRTLLDARRAASPCGWRSHRTTCARSPMRSPMTGCPRAAAEVRSRAPGPARPRRRPRGRACRPRACASGPTARSATSSPGWHISCAGCWRTRATTRSFRPGERGCRSTSCSPRRSQGLSEPLPPFANEPILELRRARGARRARRRAGGRRRASCRCAVPVRDRRRTPSGGGLHLDRSWHTRARGRRVRRRDRRRGRTPPSRWRERAAPGWRRSARRGARCLSAARGRLDARAPASSSPRWRSASAPSRGRRPTATSARRSTSSSTTRAGRCELARRAAADCRSPGERNEMALRRRAASPR